MRLDGLTSRHRSAGGPERWRVICCAAGGRHNLVLALPDNSDSDRAQRTECSPVSHWPHKLIVLSVVYTGVSLNWLLIIVKQAMERQTCERLRQWCL